MMTSDFCPNSIVAAHLKSMLQRFNGSWEYHQASRPVSWHYCEGLAGVFHRYVLNIWGNMPKFQWSNKSPSIPHLSSYLVNYTWAKWYLEKNVTNFYASFAPSFKKNYISDTKTRHLMLHRNISSKESSTFSFLALFFESMIWRVLQWFFTIENIYLFLLFVTFGCNFRV